MFRLGRLNGLKVNDTQMFHLVELQQVDTEDGKVVGGIRIPQRREDLGRVPCIVDCHANALVFVRLKLDGVHANFLVRVLNVAHVFAIFGCDRYGTKISEMLLHEGHLPFPKGHIKESIFRVRWVDGGRPRHSVGVFCLLYGRVLEFPWNGNFMS